VVKGRELGIDSDGGGRLEKPREGDAGFEAGEGCADAEVDAAAEREVAAGYGAVQVQRLRIGVGGLVQIRCGPHEQHPGAGGDVDTAELCVVEGGAVVETEWSVEAKDFLQERGNRVGLASEMVLQPVVLSDDPYCSRDQARCRLGPRTQYLGEDAYPFLERQVAALDWFAQGEQQGVVAHRCGVVDHLLEMPSQVGRLLHGCCRGSSHARFVGEAGQKLIDIEDELHELG
jgi:hypothetical protein